MALPDQFILTQGTAVVWGEAGGSGVTNTLSFDALATGAARMGASVDLGANWNRLYLVEIRVESGTAQAAGQRFDVYLASSTDNTNWPGGVTGSDAAYNTGSEAEWLQQLQNAYVGSLISTADDATTQKQNGFYWMPKGRYVAPVAYNQLGVALRDQATASDNTSRIILTPVDEKVID